MVMTLIFVWVMAISFLATLVRSTLGFGESLVAVPLFSLFMPVNAAVPLSVLISVLVALVVVIQDHRAVELKSAGWLLLSAVPGIPLGLLILTYGNEMLVKAGLGVLISGYALHALWGKNTFRLTKDSRAWLFCCGLCSGILGGAYGINGPPLAVYGNLRRWDAQTFRATLQGYFLPASVLGLLGYVYQGLMTREVLSDFMTALPAALPAIFLGRYLNRRVKGDAFYRFVYIGLLLIGVLLILLSR